jgi:hypothetical protein
VVRFAYADPPYPGQAKKHYADHPDYAGEVDHAELIGRLGAEYPDGWALSTHVRALRDLLPKCPDGVRVLAWVKPFCAWKRGVFPAYTWEPIILCGGRSRYGEVQTPRDHLSEPITLKRGVAGAKPEAFCHWLFDCLGVIEGDELDDLFPGSGAVTDALLTYFDQMRLDFPMTHDDQPLFDDEAVA